MLTIFFGAPGILFYVYSLFVSCRRNALYLACCMQYCQHRMDKKPLQSNGNLILYSERGLSSTEVERALNVFLKSSETISIVVRKHREGS